MSADLKSEINKAIQAHGNWRGRLRNAALADERDLPVADIASADHCRFGQWLQGVSAAEGGGHLPEVRRLHAEFHRIAGHIAGMIARGESAQALEAIEGRDYVQKTLSLTRTLHNWQDSL